MSGLEVEGGLVGRNVSGDVWGVVRQPISLKSLEISGVVRVAAQRGSGGIPPLPLPCVSERAWGVCVSVRAWALGHEYRRRRGVGVSCEDLPSPMACVALWGIWACLMGIWA